MASENSNMELARKRLEEDRKAQEPMRQAQAARAAGKPTPTQEENDLAACGAHIVEHEDDGSGPEPHTQARTAEAHRPAAGYQTRRTAPAGSHSS